MWSALLLLMQLLLPQHLLMTQVSSEETARHSVYSLALLCILLCVLHMQAVIFMAYS